MDIAIVCTSREIVYVDMVGDLFHMGHVKFLEKAKKLGSILYVGIHSDKDVKSYKRKPIMSMEERIYVMKHCDLVDKVIPSVPLKITKTFMKQHGIDLVVHAHDQWDDSYNLMYEIPIKLGKFHRVEYFDGVSTTEIIQRVLPYNGFVPVDYRPLVAFILRILIVFLLVALSGSFN